MKKILLHVIAVLLLANFVGRDVCRCCTFDVAVGQCGLMETGSVEYEFEANPVKNNSSELIFQTNLAAPEKTGRVTEADTRRRHKCSFLSIFSPPPNFC